MRFKQKAFTLAEILITLGIIGIVAAMTIPTLISNVNNSTFKSQYKKSLSTLNQAAKLMQARYNLDFGSVTVGCNNQSANGQKFSPLTSRNLCALFDATLSGATYLGWVSSLKVPGTTESYHLYSSTNPNVPTTGLVGYQLADGSAFGFNYQLSGCTLGIGEDITTLPDVCRGFIDVNGATLPNKEVLCSNGSATISSSVGSCIVRNNSTDMGDVFPIVYHDGIVEPATDAARYVLNQTK